LYRFGMGCKPPFTYHKKCSYLLAISGAKERKNFSPDGNLFAAQAAKQGLGKALPNKFPARGKTAELRILAPW
ncbi:MAG: hypothetical protein ACLU19_10390, partial [Faecalibacterium sp.]